MKRLLLKIRNFLKGDVEYRYQRYKTPVISTDEYAELVKKNKQLLYENGVSLKKIRFTPTPYFTYDYDRNIINPPYEIYLPVNKETGLFKKDAPVIEMVESKSVVYLGVFDYCVEDNYEFIREMVAKTKRGIVIFLADERVDDMEDIGDYHFGVYTPHLRLFDLDKAEKIEYVETEIV